MLLQSMPVCACASNAYMCIETIASNIVTALVALQAIQLLAQSLGNNDRRTADVMQQLATHYWARGNWEAGEVCATSHSYRRAARPFREWVCWLCMRHHCHNSSAGTCWRGMQARQCRCRHGVPRRWMPSVLRSGPAHVFTIRTLQRYAGCLGARAGWPQAAEMLGDYLGQLRAAGLGDSDGEPAVLH